MTLLVLLRLGLVASQCLVCGSYYRLKLAHGAQGGISHGLCDRPSCKVAMRVQMGLAA